jgi:hypothetical protein
LEGRLQIVMEPKPEPVDQRTWLQKARDYYKGNEATYWRSTHDVALQLAQQVGCVDDDAICYTASRIIDRFNQDEDWNLKIQHKPKSNPDWWQKPKI